MSAKHSGRSVVPQQRMLRLMSLTNRAAAAYFNLKPSKVEGNTYTLTLTPTNLQKQAGSQVTTLVVPDCRGLTSANMTGAVAIQMQCVMHACG